MLIKADLHNHTTFSFDGELNPLRFVERYVERGFGAVAVTDHNTCLGALAVRDLDPPFKVIIGSEIKTTGGELIGLFLEKDVKRDMSPVDTAKAIHDAGGLTLLPHPFIKAVLTRMSEHLLPELLPHLDIIEGLNARGANPAEDRDALLWGRQAGLAVSAGSDAHSRSAVGSGFVIMEDFEGPEDFLEKLRAATVVNTRREMLLRAAGNLIYGYAWGVTRVKRMIKKHEEGVPVRDLWDDPENPTKGKWW